MTVESVLMLPTGVEALSLDPLVERVTIRDEARLILRCAEYDSLAAVIARRAERHERRRRTLLRQIARAERVVEESSAALDNATTMLQRSRARVDCLNEAVAAVNEATATVSTAEQVLGRARARLDEVETHAQRLNNERAALERAAHDAEARVRAYETVDEGAQPWDDADLCVRIEQARSSAADARGLVTEALATLQQAEATVVDAGRCREALLQAAAECRMRLEARCHLDESEVRAALQAYEEAAADRGSDAHASRLAAEVTAISSALAEAIAANQRPQPTEDELQAARERVAAAAARLDEVRQHAHRNVLTPQERAELEEAYQIVTSDERTIRGNSRRTAKRRPFRGAKARITDAQARLDSLLSGHGFTDFLDYRLHHTHGDTSAARALELARAELEAAYAALTALERSSGPTEEVRELERTRAELHREGVELLGFDPGELLPEVLETKADVPASVTARLITALTDAGGTPLRHSIDVEARAWLCAFEAEQEACADVEAQLVLLDAQLAAVDRIDPGPDQLEAVKLAVETIVALADDRARYAERVAEVLEWELEARRDAEARGQGDASRRLELATSAEAVRWLIDWEERRSQGELEAAAGAVGEATAALEAARNRRDASHRQLIELLGRAPEASSLLAEALGELDRALTAATEAHEQAAGAMAGHSEAQAWMARARETSALHACSAPPALSERPGPMDVVMASRWIANRDDHPVIVLLATRADTEEVGTEVIDALLELSREYWVVTTTQVVNAALEGEPTRVRGEVRAFGPRARGSQGARSAYVSHRGGAPK